ncbi:hypothetical protein ACXR0O_25460 [Verrucomicrobiota bacterium sgz303538]
MSTSATFREQAFTAARWCVGGLLTVLILCQTVTTDGSGAAPYLAICFVTPFVALRHAIHGSGGTPALLLAFGQFPLYAAILIIAAAQGWFRAASRTLLATHFDAALIAVYLIWPFE